VRNARVLAFAHLSHVYHDEQVFMSLTCSTTSQTPKSCWMTGAALKQAASLTIQQHGGYHQPSAWRGPRPCSLFAR